MNKMNGLSFILIAGITLSGCSNILDAQEKADVDVAFKGETGRGRIELLTPIITTKDNQLEFKTKGINETKMAFVFVANKKVFEKKIKNGESYKLNIKNVKDAHRTDYEPKVQLMQTEDDTENGDIITFKQVRYTVEKD
ncbi:hypothetical protein [Bacillus sp. 1P06AnD]|uniref:hypothetical protein n=1 Tax=Bacillus sp. 1P06AnD TaxID=3132208 RepID=UPI0039A1D0C5